MVSIVDFAPGTDSKGLKATLRRKELARHVALSDAVLRLDIATPLGQEARPVIEAHIAAGGAPEACTWVTAPPSCDVLRG